MIPIMVSAQTFEKRFGGWIGSCTYRFYFKKNNTYLWGGFGECGGNVRKGSYYFSDDTIYCRYKATDTDKKKKTYFQKFILDKDSFLIDVNSRYDYKPTTEKFDNLQASQIRLIKYPQHITNDKSAEATLFWIISDLIKHPEVTALNELFRDTIRFVNYYTLKDTTASSVIDLSKTIQFSSKQFLKVPYIEISDINFNPKSISIELLYSIGSANKRVSINYSKIGSNWLSGTPHMY